MPSSAIAEREKPETKEAGPLAVLRSQLEERAGEFRMVLPSHITPEKLQRTVLTAAQQNPDLIRCERRSFLTACMKAAQDALLPDGREAAIVPFNHRFKDEDGWHTIKMAQYMPMVWGLRKKILQSGEITDIFAGVVYAQEIEAGRFIYEEGTERTLRHKPIIEPDFRPQDEDVALAYSVATFANGTKSFEVLRRWEIDQIREASQTGALFDAKGNPREAKGPWVEWFGEMAKKSVIRRHSKSLPQSGDILPDVEAEDMQFAAKSAVALLDSAKPDAPKPLPDEGFDRETGEIVDKPEQPEPKPDPEKEPEPKPEPEPEPEPLQDEGDVGLTEGPQPPPVEPPADEGGTDEYGITKDPNDKLAEDFIARAKRCELLVDLRKLEKEADLALAAMPPEMAAFVDEEFARTRQRLTPAPKAVT